METSRHRGHEHVEKMAIGKEGFKFQAFYVARFEISIS
jgi:hypothetical protein